MTTFTIPQMGPNACNTALESIQQCAQDTPYFDKLLPSVKASCHCFDTNGFYTGEAWDRVAGDCFQTMRSQSLGARVEADFVTIVDLCTKSVDAHWRTAGVVHEWKDGLAVAQTTASQTTASQPNQTVIVTAVPTSAGRKDSGTNFSSTQARIIIGLIISVFSIVIILIGFLLIRRHRIRKRSATQADARTVENDQPYLQRKTELEADEMGFHEMGPGVKPGGMVAVTILHEMGPTERGRQTSTDRGRRASSVQELESPEYPPSPGRRQLQRTFSELG